MMMMRRRRRMRSAYTEVPTPHASSVKCNDMVDVRNNKYIYQK
jgi:hypothetical protein